MCALSLVSTNLLRVSLIFSTYNNVFPLITDIIFVIEFYSPSTDKPVAPWSLNFKPRCYLPQFQGVLDLITQSLTESTECDDELGARIVLLVHDITEIIRTATASLQYVLTF